MILGEASKRPPTTISINSLDHDTLCLIFSFLDLFDLVRSSAVCSFWNRIISWSHLLHILYLNQIQNTSQTTPPANLSGKSLGHYLEELALEQHRSALVQAPVIHVDRWRGCSSVGTISQCRMKMGSLLTGGVGDKFVRLWSIENSICLKEYPVPEMTQLIDFDFDETKVVGLLRTRLCIWRRHENGKRSVFPSREGTFSQGVCMRYFDPEAVVGCEDGTVRIFDMYSRSCSRILRMHYSSITCLALSEDQLIVSGSDIGGVTVSGLSSDQRVSTLKSSGSAGIKTLCFSPGSHQVFAGSTSGSVFSWDLRMMKMMWQTKASTNVIYSMQTILNDKSTLVIGGIDGVLRILDQNTGDVLSRCVMGGEEVSTNLSAITQTNVARRRGRRISEDIQIDSIPRTFRPPITCLAVGMKKVATTHNNKNIRVWKFIS